MESEVWKPTPIQPRVIIHGGAGNLTRKNIPSEAYKSYRDALFEVIESANDLLSKPGVSALDVATYAVSLLEDNGRFNSGHGAVFTTAGTHELEASVMVSRGYRKRGVGVMKVTTAKNPIKLAREMLIRGERADGGGAQGHCQLEGETCDRLAKEWGLETAPPSYFWTRKRWDEHRKGLGLSHSDEEYDKHKRRADELIGQPLQSPINSPKPMFTTSSGDIHWDGKEYLPQGTVGAVVMDDSGVLCVATSTGGITNKLPGRIGDTPTLGAGFWAEEWTATSNITSNTLIQTPISQFADILSDCLPRLAGYMSVPSQPSTSGNPLLRGVAMSGTGNGDSFLKLAAVHTAASMARFGSLSLQKAVTAVAGPHGMLQHSAEDRWKSK